MALILSIIAAILIAYQIYSFVRGKPRNSPPGPSRLPIWGSYWFLLWGDYKFPHKTIAYYVKKYKSKIISLYMGDFYTIVANDYASVKEVLSRKEFDGRLHEVHLARARAFGKKLGVFFNDDTEWLVQRRFALRNMRDFGFGRRHEKLERVIAHEVSLLVDILKNGPNELEKYDMVEHDGVLCPYCSALGHACQTGRIFNTRSFTTIAKNDLALFPDVLYASSANPIWFVMSGEIYDRDEHEKLRELCRKAMVFQRHGDTTGGALALTPWLRYFGDDGFGFNGVMRGNYAIVDFIKKFVNKRKSFPLTDDDKMEGFLDVYLNKLKEAEGTCGFSEEQLFIITVDVMFPALSAVPSMLTHFIKFMMHYPDVMKKVQSEIDDVVGRSRLPEWNDRNKLPYTEATMREVFRSETLTPWSVIHRAMESTTLMGYDVPANTVVVTNLAHMHNDPDQWGDPENFRPERFLTEDGERLGKDFSLPFGFGRRVCAGETFARFILFAQFASLAQNFNFEFVDGQPTRLDDVLPGLIVTPKETWIRVVSR